MTWRAVVFDLDETLVVEEAVARASLRSAVALVPGVDLDWAGETVLGAAQALWRSGPHYQLALELGIASWEALWSRFKGCHRRLDGLRDWAGSSRKQAWQAAVAELGADDPGLGSAMGAASEHAQRSGHPLTEGAKEAVGFARQHFRTGLLTDGTADIQRLKLAQSGLGGLFDAIVVSGEAGVAKPSPAGVPPRPRRAGGQPRGSAHGGR